MTVNEQYRSFLQELENIYTKPEADKISSIVFENITGITKAGLIKDPGKLFDENLAGRFNEALSALKLYKPVQYITSEAWFYRMKLKVSPAVLIPRPETEELVEELINYLRDKPAATVLDIGTGSGCIAIAIKKNLPNEVTAIDISEQALAIAKENSREQQVYINFIPLDFLNEPDWMSLISFDVIISNPPYIPENEKQSLDKNVTAFEPHLALFVEDNRPLIFYEKIAAFGKTHLTKDGKIFMEIHEDLAEQTAALFNNETYTCIIKKDISGKQRMVIASLRYP